MNTYTLKELCEPNEERRSDFLISTATKRLWNIQLNMLDTLLNVCNKHHLKVFMDSGTLLGAVRHKGYIPWDDDIDVAMPREDYDRLVEIAPGEFEGPYYFQSAHHESGYYRGHAQMRFDGTSMILPSEAKLGYSFNQGVFIDIFVIDGIPEEGERRRIGQEVADIHNFLWCRKYLIKRISSPEYICLKKQLGHKAKWPDHRLYSYTEDLFRQNTVEACRRCGLFSLHLEKEKDGFDCRLYDSVVYMPFERLSVPVPAGYHDILRGYFGDDYMTPRHTPAWHGSTLIDTERSYKTLLPGLQMPAYKIVHRILKMYMKRLGSVFGIK